MRLRGFRESSIAVTGVVMILATVGRAPVARAEDRPCVPPPEGSPPPYNAPPVGPPSAAYESPYPSYVVVERPYGRARGHVPIELTPSFGYSFSTGVPVDGGSLAFGPSPVFGLTVDIGDWYGLHFVGAYMLQWAGLELDSDSGGTQPQYTVTAHHFQLGGEFDILRGRVRPFLGLLAGAVWYSPQSDVPDELWFEGSIEVGAKVRITKLLGIRAQATITGITMDERSQVFCANGCYTEWYGIGTSMLALTAGPTLRF